MHVRDWLLEEGLQRYASIFLEHRLDDLHVCSTIDDKDLIEALDRTQHRHKQKYCVSKEAFTLPSYWLQKIKNPYSIVLQNHCLNGLHAKCLNRRNGKKFHKIRYLSLKQNRITRIHDTQFDSLPELIMLNLQDNRLSTVRQRWFKYTPRLTSLDLKTNLIAKLEMAGEHMVRFTYFDLSNNRIPLLTEHSFSVYTEKPKHYRQVYMGTNDLTCICDDIKWFAVYGFHNIEFGMNSCPFFEMTQDCLFVRSKCSVQMLVVRNKMLIKCGMVPGTTTVEVVTERPTTTTTMFIPEEPKSSRQQDYTTTTWWIETTTNSSAASAMMPAMFNALGYLVYVKIIVILISVMMVLSALPAILQSRREKSHNNRQIEYYKHSVALGLVENKSDDGFGFMNLLGSLVTPKAQPKQENHWKR